MDFTGNIEIDSELDNDFSSTAGTFLGGLQQLLYTKGN